MVLTTQSQKCNVLNFSLLLLYFFKQNTLYLMISCIVLQVRVIFSHYFSILLIYVLTKPKSFLNDSKIDPNRQTLSKQASPISSQLNEFLISVRKKTEKSLTKNLFLANFAIVDRQNQFLCSIPHGKWYFDTSILYLFTTGNIGSYL